MPKLYQLRNILSDKNKKLIYVAWVESLLLYGIEVYGFASKYIIERLQRTQNRIVKILFHRCDTTNDCYSKNNILRIIQLRDYRIVLKNFFTFKDKKPLVRDGTLRDSSIKYKLPLYRNDYGTRNKAYYLPNIFNKFPSTFYAIKKHGELKIKLKQALK